MICDSLLKAAIVASMANFLRVKAGGMEQARFSENGLGGWYL